MTYSLTTLFVKDIEKSLEFFTNVLGLTVTRRAPGENGPVFLGEDGKPNIELIAGNTEAAFSGFSLGFSVGSLDQASQKLEAANCTRISGPVSPNPHIRLSVFRNPDGIEIELIETL
ncbi:MAG: VOC family protein [Treponema sp.]|jgi:lactoylglutathione lyase|nr:VOC family protein [Treponema sp.]